MLRMTSNTPKTAPKPALTKEQKIQAEIDALALKLKQARAKQTAALAAIRTEEAKTARKVIDRKKYLVGAWALSTMSDEAVKTAMAGYLRKEEERGLFGLA